MDGVRSGVRRTPEGAGRVELPPLFDPLLRLEGGIYLYPAAASSGKPSGKIRLLYECHPLAFVVEQAGGRASTGRERVLDLAPRRLHERIPVAIGSAFEVDLYEQFARGARR